MIGQRRSRASRRGKILADIEGQARRFGAALKTATGTPPPASSALAASGVARIAKASIKRGASLVPDHLSRRVRTCEGVFRAT